MMRLVLCDLNPRLVRAWQRYFGAIPDVHIECGDMLRVQADALVSPANSFGFMDGGLDQAISDFFGGTIQ